jgi:hypothetical protein
MVLPFHLPCHVSAGWINVVHSMSWAAVGTSQMTNNYGFMMAIYTQQTGANWSVLSRLTSVSFSLRMEVSGATRVALTHPMTTGNSGYQYGATSSAGSNLSSAYSGVKAINYPINSIMTPGNYWLGLMMTRATTGFTLGPTVRVVGNNALYQLSMSPIGSFSNSISTGTRFHDAMNHFRFGFGYYSSANVSPPDTVTISSMTAPGFGANFVSGIPHIVLWSTAGTDSGIERLP